jgi:hypothetical protein
MINCGKNARVVKEGAIAAITLLYDSLKIGIG